MAARINNEEKLKSRISNEVRRQGNEPRCEEN